MLPRAAEREFATSRRAARDVAPVSLCEGLYARAGKRAFDVACAVFGLIVLAPLLAAVAIAVKLSSRGPIFFRQERVGRYGRLFSIVKFRTMTARAAESGPRITSSGDPRITSFGRFLRRYKLDESPQLWNVLRGDMSFVGPRPELASYVALYSPAQAEVLTVRPGITDTASLAYRHEEELLAMHPEPERFYSREILPRKLDYNLEYIGAMSFATDLKLIFRTLKSVFAAPREKMER
ncbi:MAG: sugar transferase [Candidatus Acidiferrales bacterium]